MSERPRAELVISGQVIVEARPGGFEMAEAVGIAHGRVVAVGERREVMGAAAPAARVIRADGVVVPGLHDFHLHLVGMARARRMVDLSGAVGMDELVARVRRAADATPREEWVRGDGWSSEALDPAGLDRLEGAVAGRPAYLKSHDRHSAWASAEALSRAGFDGGASDPEGGRFERTPDGRPNGLLRERAADLVGEHAGRLSGPDLEAALGEVVEELLGLGFTGATDAGDATSANGAGRYASLGDSFSSLSAAASVFDGRFRATLDFPVEAMGAAAGEGIRTGAPLPGTVTVTAGWAKVYADGALGSRTAAVFSPYGCGGGTGILRLAPEELDAIVGGARAAGIGLAVHAIGDRAAAGVLDALERGEPQHPAVPPDRMEHLQLVRSADLPRLARLDVTASLQPLHLPADRETAERCWPDRLADAYPMASLAAAGARLAFGSDAPIEAPNPWLAIHVAVHRRLPGEPVAWRTDEGITPGAALAAYTAGPARGAGRDDIGHLRAGAVADLAVLDCDLETLATSGPALTDTASTMTMVAGRIVYRR